MSSYQAQHARALAQVKRKGAALTVTKGATVVHGYAVQSADDVEQYAALDLTKSVVVTLLFVATTYGEAPPLAGRFTWGDDTFVVAKPNPYAPDGVPIYSAMIGSR